MFFTFLAQRYLDFSVEVVVILGVTAEDEKNFVDIVDVGRMRKCDRLGDAKLGKTAPAQPSSPHMCSIGAIPFSKGSLMMYFPYFFSAIFLHLLL
jgi:hypothetical protein